MMNLLDGVAVDGILYWFGSRSPSKFFCNFFLFILNFSENLSEIKKITASKYQTDEISLQKKVHVFVYIGPYIFWS